MKYIKKFNELNNNEYCWWYIKTNDVDEIAFAMGDPKINPLENDKIYDGDENWKITSDCSAEIDGDYVELCDYYSCIEEDGDEIALIPKKDVLKVWCGKLISPYKVDKVKLS